MSRNYKTRAALLRQEANAFRAWQTQALKRLAAAQTDLEAWQALIDLHTQAQDFAIRLGSMRDEIAWDVLERGAK